MARAGDEEGKGQEAQKGGHRLILRSRLLISQIRPNILPILSTCTLYSACTQFVGPVLIPLL